MANEGFNKVRFGNLVWDVEQGTEVEDAREAIKETMPQVENAQHRVVEDGEDRVLEFYRPIGEKGA